MIFLYIFITQINKEHIEAQIFVGIIVGKFTANMLTNYD